MGSSPTIRTKLSRLSIMDNTVGFYPSDGSSILSGETSCWAVSLMVKQSTHNRLSIGSIPIQPTNAPMTELVYVSDSKSEFCEFESRLGHQICRWSQLDGHWIANPWKQVRFLSPTPKYLLTYKIF